MLSPDELRLRSTGIGSSDIAALVGESPYANAHSVWLDKLGLREVEESEPMWWGTAMEPLVGKRYQKETGVALIKGEIGLRHPTIPIAIASPDFIHADRSKLVECKVAFRTGREWTQDADGAPNQYILQANWQCGVLGIEAADIAVFIAEWCEFRVYEWAFDKALFEHCVAIAERFWRDHVVAREPPPVDHSEHSCKALEARFPQRAPLKDAPPEAEQLVRARLEIADRLESIKKDYDLTNNKLREMIGEAEGMRGQWGWASWKTDKRGVRSLRVYPKKERIAA